MKFIAVTIALLSAVALAAPVEPAPNAAAPIVGVLADDYACVCQYPNNFPFVRHCGQCGAGDEPTACRTLRSKGTICA